jgi:Fe-S-cluster-containing dehydrogenase component
MKTLLIDVRRCIGCYNCQIACKDEHVGNNWLPYAKAQEEGQFWMKVSYRESGKLPKVRSRWIPSLCMHCDDAPCAKVCPHNAIKIRNDGIVLIDPEVCQGEQKCREACPYDAIYFNDELKISQKCTFCAHLLDQGWKEPRCVTACPTDALCFGEEEELKDLIARAELLPSHKGEKGEAPQVRVFYLNLPKLFIAGEVYDPVTDECLEGVIVTLSNMAKGETYQAKTDNYGDFWLEPISTGEYSLLAEKEGYYPKEIRSIQVDRDLNLGEIKLYKYRG